MKFITNIFKNKEILIYLVILIIVIFIIYYLFSYKDNYIQQHINNKYIEGLNLEPLMSKRNYYGSQNPNCKYHNNKKKCFYNSHQCIWYANTERCINKNTCNVNEKKCKNNFYCNWNQYSKTCQFKPFTRFLI